MSHLVLTVAPHAHGQAFLQSAILTSISVMFGHFAILVTTTLVSQLFSKGPFEEAFATFTADSSIMATCK